MQSPSSFKFQKQKQSESLWHISKRNIFYRQAFCSGYKENLNIYISFRSLRCLDKVFEAQILDYKHFSLYMYTFIFSAKDS